MPPKRTSSKRKASPEPSSDSGSEPARAKAPAKRSKIVHTTTQPPSELAPGAQPTNKVLPDTILFPAREQGTLRISSWNICGLAASVKKGFKAYVEAEDPDILVLTETKVNEPSVDPFLKDRFPYSYWSISSKKGYAGTAILSKHEPLSATTTLPGHPDPGYVKGRIVVLEFARCFVVGTYVPNAGTGLKTLPEKNLWNTHFTAYIRSLDARKPVIWTGDLNVAPTEIDLKNAKSNWNKTPGYTEAETTAFHNILNPPPSDITPTSALVADSISAHVESTTTVAQVEIIGTKSDDAVTTMRSKTSVTETTVIQPSTNKFLDIWRVLHPTDQHYTYFSYRFNCRAKGVGWRIDMFVVSERFKNSVKACEIRSEIYGASDHCPLVLDIEGGL